MNHHPRNRINYESSTNFSACSQPPVTISSHYYPWFTIINHHLAIRSPSLGHWEKIHPPHWALCYGWMLVFYRDHHCQLRLCWVAGKPAWWSQPVNQWLVILWKTITHHQPLLISMAGYEAATLNLSSHCWWFKSLRNQPPTWLSDYWLYVFIITMNHDSSWP